MTDDWMLYFDHICIFEKNIWMERYQLIDRSVTALPKDLPMPPTTNLSFLFAECYNLQDISALSNWDVSEVENMCYMFHNCRCLRDLSPLSDWDVSNVTNMYEMFSYCISLDKWDVSVISRWNISRVKYMSSMFNNCPELQYIASPYDRRVNGIDDPRCFFKTYQ